MKLHTTLILLIVAIGLGAYIGVYERGSIESAGKTSNSGKMLTSFDTEQISRIVIESGDSTTELRRHLIYWVFTAPIGDRANAQTVDAVLDQLGHLAIEDELRPGELLNSSELSDDALGFGSEDTIRVSLYAESAAESDAGDRDGERPVSVLVLGKTAPLSNTLYARIESDPSRAALTYVVSGTPRRYLTDPVASLRDRSLLGVPTDQVVRVVVRTAAGEVEVSRKITPPQVGWTVTKPLQTRADAAMMEGFLSRLAGLQISEVIEEDASSSPLPQQIPSGAAGLDLTVYGWDQPLSLYLSPKANATPVADDIAAGDRDEEADGKDDSNEPLPTDSQQATGDDPQSPILIARVSTRPGIYEIRSPLLADLPDSPSKFRDPYLARIPVQYLHSIIIVSRTDPKVVLTSESTPEGVRWYSARSGIKDRANLERLKRMLNAINGGRVLDFLPIEAGDLEKYGLRSSELRIAFNFLSPQAGVDDEDGGGAPKDDQAKPQAAQQRILQFGRTDENNLYANFVGEPWVYKIDPTIRSAIPSHPLKWRDLKVMNFNLIGLRQIERSRAGDPPITLTYDYTVDTWGATEAGNSVTDRLDTVRAMTLARTLGSLEAVDWITNLQSAYQALEEPSLEISLVRREIDPLTNTLVNVSEQLRFAKGPGSSYYGTIVGSLDVFLISRDTYNNLIYPLIP